MHVAASPATRLARPIQLASAWNASDADVAERFHPHVRRALERVPAGEQVFRGLPFQLGDRGAGRRWLAVDHAPSIDIPVPGRASHLVVAHFADSWRDEDGGRPAGAPVGWVLGIGQTLAHYELTTTDGARRTVDIRRRFEVNDAIIGWGYLPFAAVGHLAEEVVDWRGPHPRQGPGRYAAVGDAGPLTMLPGAWGPDLTGIADHLPTPDDDLMLWLHAIALTPGTELAHIRLLPADGGARSMGSAVIVAGMTLFDGTADPLVLRPRRQLLVRGAGDALPDVDLGIAIRSQRVPAGDADTAGPGPIGWGRPGGRGAPDDPSPAAVDTILDVALAPDATLRFGPFEIDAGRLDNAVTRSTTGVTIRPLPSADIPVQVTIIDPDGASTPARVRFVAADGRYLPPVGHRDEINPGLFEDMGTDLILGRDTYAYVPGAFEVRLPPGRVTVEVVKGFDHRPVRLDLDVGPTTVPLVIALERPIDLRAEGWTTADPHVHFLAPSTALLQAAAEDIGFVHVLATQWGDQFTSVNDLAWGSMTDPTGRHAVVLGTENRQNMLGHMGLLGARRPVMPLSTGSGPEGRIGDPVTELMADWADRCHAEGGLVVAAHFPLPFAEIATDIVTGRIDGVEMQVFAPGLDNPSILEWYRFLNCGYRLPVMGGTDKMSSEVPVGAVRTYARLEPDREPTFEAWSAAVRAGRTFATSGPVIAFSVDGHEPGDVISLPANGGRLAGHVRVRASQPVISAVEIVVNGEVVAMVEPGAASADVTLDAPIHLTSSAWVAARSRSAHQIHSAFDTSMASHSSPIYVEVGDRPLLREMDALSILEVIDGTLRWIDTMATVVRAEDRRRMHDLIAASAVLLRERLERATAGGTQG